MILSYDNQHSIISLPHQLMCLHIDYIFSKRFPSWLGLEMSNAPILSVCSCSAPGGWGRQERGKVGGGQGVFETGVRQRSLPEFSCRQRSWS